VRRKLLNLRELLRDNVARAKRELLEHVKEIVLTPVENMTRYAITGNWEMLPSGDSVISMVARGGFEPPTVWVVRSDSPFGESRTVPSSTRDARNPVSTPSPTIPGAWFDGVFPPRSLNRPPFVSHIFSIAGSNTARRGGVVKAAFFAPRSGRSEAQSLDWPPAISTLASGKWEITRSRGRRVFPAALFFCPPTAAAQGSWPPRLSAALRGL
jgi:hypothetical protein